MTYTVLTWTNRSCSVNWNVHKPSKHLRCFLLSLTSYRLNSGSCPFWSGTWSPSPPHASASRPNLSDNWWWNCLREGSLIEAWLDTSSRHHQDLQYKHKPVFISSIKHVSLQWTYRRGRVFSMWEVPSSNLGVFLTRISQMLGWCLNWRHDRLFRSLAINSRTDVHSCQQKSIGLKFSKSQTGSDLRYICHHNSSRFTFPIFAHSCSFSVHHSLQSITPRIY